MMDMHDIHQQSNDRRDRLMHGAEQIVRLVRIANRAFLVAVGAGLLASWMLAGQFAHLVAAALPGSDIPSAMAGMRWLMLLGIAMAVVTDRLLSVLIAITATARTGDPFIADNVARLRGIGWCLLILQLFEIPGAVIAEQFPAMGAAAPSGDFSIGGWIAVLMVFVLSRVFAVGTVMRDDLAGTV